MPAWKAGERNIWARPLLRHGQALLLDLDDDRVERAGEVGQHPPPVPAAQLLRHLLRGLHHQRGQLAAFPKLRLKDGAHQDHACLLA